MEKQLGWACKSGGGESLGTSKACQTVLAMLMEPQIWHQPTALWLCGRLGSGGAQKRDNDLCSPRCQTLQSFPVCHWCPSSCHPGVRAQREWVWVGESMCGFFKRNCLGGSAVSFTDSILTGFRSQKLWWLMSLPLETWTRGPGVGLGFLTPEMSLLNVYPPHMG